MPAKDKNYILVHPVRLDNQGKSIKAIKVSAKTKNEAATKIWYKLNKYFTTGHESFEDIKMAFSICQHKKGQDDPRKYKISSWTHFEGKRIWKNKSESTLKVSSWKMPKKSNKITIRIPSNVNKKLSGGKQKGGMAFLYPWDVYEWIKPNFMEMVLLLE